MSNTLRSPTLAALTAHAVEAYKSYAGPFPTWADTSRKCASVFAKRAAFGLTGVTRLELEDTTENRALLDRWGKELHAASIEDAVKSAEFSIALQTGPDYVSYDEHVTALQEAGFWPEDVDNEYWHFTAMHGLIFNALTQK